LTGYSYERIYDIGKRQSVNLYKDLPSVLPDGGVVQSGSGSPSLQYLLSTTALRSDGQAFAKVMPGTGDTIVVGRPSDLHTFTIPNGGVIGGVTFIGTDLALLTKYAGADREVVGIQRMDATTGALTQLVAQTLADEWVGVAGFCSPGQSSGSCGFFGSAGCTLYEPSCSDGRAPRCLVTYSKIDPSDPTSNPDGTGVTKTAGFVYDVGAGSVTKLDGAYPDHFLFNSASHLLVWGSTTDNSMHWWNTCSDTVSHCDTWPSPLFAWRPDGTAFAMYGVQQMMRIVNVSDGTCTQADPQTTFSVYQAQYSPNSDRLWWVSADDTGETSFSLWLADGNAASPTAVASGPDLSATFSGDGQHLYVSHNGQ